jgi:hypothetical protein
MDGFKMDTRVLGDIATVAAICAENLKASVS